MEAQGEKLRRLVGLFAKRPRAGQVKTRLAPVLGIERAALFARALLDDGSGRLCADSEGELVFAPGEERAWFEAAYPGIALRAQVGAGLAERMENWFSDVLGSGSLQGAAAVGCDAPWVDKKCVDQAFARLAAGADVVLGPDMGGGYYLVALARPQPGMFREIEMSTGTMFDETCAWVRGRGLELALLDEDYDVDDAADWERLIRDLDTGRLGEVAAVRDFVRRFRAGDLG